MSNKGAKLTKNYEFDPWDLQWDIDEIAEDFTLYDLFKIVHDAEKSIPGIAKTFGMPHFDKFWDILQRPRDPDDDDNLTHLELYWHMGYDVRITKKTGKPTDQRSISILTSNDKNYWDNPMIGEMSNLMSFHGIGQGCSAACLDFHTCDDNCETDHGRAIEFTPVNNLSHLPIRVLPEVKCYPPHVESDRDFKKTGFKLIIKPTLWCIITSVFWELTFAGTEPEIVADSYHDLMNTWLEAKDQLEKKNEDSGDKL